MGSISRDLIGIGVKVKSTKNIKINNTEYVLCLTKDDSESVTVDIDVFEVKGECYQEKGVVYDPPKPYYPLKGSNCSYDTTYDTENAQRVVSAYVKWDGCSDIDFYPDSDGNEHYCGKNSAVQLGSVIESVYDFAKEALGPEVIHDLGLFNGD
jgi:hypothetical protein